jgi:tetratricopeptide (TPR) repeat protein
MHALLLALLLATPDAANASAQREMGKALFKQGRVDEAIARFEEAVRLNPSDAVAWYDLAYSRRQAEKFEPAAAAYRVYTALAPDDPDGYFGLAESLRHSGKAADAIAAYTAYISKENRPSEKKWVAQAKRWIEELKPPPPPAAPAAPAPDRDPAPLLKTGDEALFAKNYGKALMAYQDAIMIAPDNLEARMKAGQCYARLGHDDEAIAQWTKVLEADPKNAGAREALAAARERRGERSAALPPPHPPRPQPSQPSSADAGGHYTKGVAFIRDRKYDEGAAELDRAIAAKPGFAVALVARGSARIGQGRFEDAVADYSAAQKADPQLAAPLFGLAEAYRSLGQNEKAAQFYRQFASSTSPDAEQRLKDYASQAAQALSPQ